MVWKESRFGRVLQFHDLVIVAVGLDGIVDLVKKIASIARDKVHAADAALLQLSLIHI